MHLLARVREGDRGAFGELLTRYLSRALSLATRIVRHREDAEDVVQDAFLRALDHIEQFDASRPFWPWLARIVVNRGLDVATRRATRDVVELGDDLVDRRPDPAEAAERAEVSRRFREAVGGLSPRRRLVVQLFELDGFSVAEIAQLIGGSTATVRWHLHMARRDLRAALSTFRPEEV